MGISTAAPAYEDAAATAPPSLHAWYAAIILALSAALSGIDRKLPYILVESIKGDLGLSDTQIGLLTGPMFAIVYSTMGIPLAALADRRSRTRLLGWAIFVWSALTALGGFAQGFWHLALSRAGVAGGEAACTPAAHSMIGDYFSPRFRARALSVYQIGSPLGLLLGLMLGGWINEIANWRTAMWLLGAPGLVLWFLVLFTVKEPPRRPHPDPAVGVDAPPSMLQAAAIILRQPIIVHLFVGSIFINLTLTGVQAFAPSYIIRTFGLGTGVIGLTYGLVLGGAGILGAVLGGLLGDHLRKRHPWKGIALVAMLLGLSAPLAASAYLMPTYPLYLLMILVTQVMIYMNTAPLFATVQSLLSPRLHGMAAAIYLLGVNGVGLAAGPLLTGLISDLIHAGGAKNALGSSMMLLTIPLLFAAAHFAIAASKLRKAEQGQPA